MNPFRIFPRDIVGHITQYLSASDLLNLCDFDYCDNLKYFHSHFYDLIEIKREILCKELFGVKNDKLELRNYIETSIEKQVIEFLLRDKCSEDVHGYCRRLVNRIIFCKKDKKLDYFSMLNFVKKYAREFINIEQLKEDLISKDILIDNLDRQHMELKFWYKDQMSSQRNNSRDINNFLRNFKILLDLFDYRNNRNVIDFLEHIILTEYIHIKLLDFAIEYMSKRKCKNIEEYNISENIKFLRQKSYEEYKEQKIKDYLLQREKERLKEEFRLGEIYLKNFDKINKEQEEIQKFARESEQKQSEHKSDKIDDFDFFQPSSEEEFEEFEEEEEEFEEYEEEKEEFEEYEEE